MKLYGFFGETSFGKLVLAKHHFWQTSFCKTLFGRLYLGKLHLEWFGCVRWLRQWKKWHWKYLKPDKTCWFFLTKLFFSWWNLFFAKLFFFTKLFLVLANLWRSLFGKFHLVKLHLTWISCNYSFPGSETFQITSIYIITVTLIANTFVMKLFPMQLYSFTSIYINC